MRFAIHDAVGRILRVVTCSEADAALNAHEGEAFIEVPVGVADDTHYIGAEGQPVAMPERPSAAHVFDFAVLGWVDPRTLDDLRVAKWAQIKAARDAAERAPLVTNFGTFDADPAGRTNLTDTILLLQSLAAIGQPAEIDFTLADNQVVTLGLSQMIQVGIALGLQVQAAYNTGRVLRGAIGAANSAADIEAIHWPGS